jgi:hypothetical protein
MRNTFLTTENTKVFTEASNRRVIIKNLFAFLAVIGCSLCFAQSFSYNPARPYCNKGLVAKKTFLKGKDKQYYIHSIRTYDSLGRLETVFDISIYKEYNEAGKVAGHRGPETINKDSFTTHYKYSDSLLQYEVTKHYRYGDGLDAGDSTIYSFIDGRLASKLVLNENFDTSECKIYFIRDSFLVEKDIFFPRGVISPRFRETWHSGTDDIVIYKRGETTDTSVHISRVVGKKKIFETFYNGKLEYQAIEKTTKNRSISRAKRIINGKVEKAKYKTRKRDSIITYTRRLKNYKVKGWLKVDSQNRPLIGKEKRFSKMSGRKEKSELRFEYVYTK